MKLYHFLPILIFFACNSHESSKDQKEDVNAVLTRIDRNSNIEILISSRVEGPGEIGYTIFVNEDSISTSVNESVFFRSEIELGEIIQNEQRELLDEELLELLNLKDSLKCFEVYHKNDDQQVQDDYYYKITFGNARPIEIYSVFMYEEEFKELKNLVDYVKSISPIKIELRGFS